MKFFIPTCESEKHAEHVYKKILSYITDKNVGTGIIYNNRIYYVKWNHKGKIY